MLPISTKSAASAPSMQVPVVVQLFDQVDQMSVMIFKCATEILKGANSGVDGLLSCSFDGSNRP